jgi:hypothetical protein
LLFDLARYHKAAHVNTVWKILHGAASCRIDYCELDIPHAMDHA